MPLDPSIPLKAQVAQIQDPYTALSQVLQGQKAASELRQVRQAEADDRAIRQVLTETGGNMEAALPRLRQIAPAAALKFETEIANQRKAGFETLKAETEFKGKRLDLGLKVAQSVGDEPSYRAARPMLLALSPDLEQFLPETYDPTRMQQLLDMGLSAKEKADKRNESLKLFTDGKAAEGLGTWLSTAGTAEEWDETKQRALDLGVPPALVAQFGAWSPDAPVRAAQLTITPTKREELAGQAATRAQTAAHQTTLEQQAAERLTQTAAHQGVLEQQGAQRVAIARQRLAQGGGDGPDREALIGAVLESPGLWDQITPTERGKIAGELQRRGFTGFGKPLSDAAIGKISDSKSAIASLTDLRGVLQANEQYIGPVAGLAALNPYSAAARANADIDRVRQRVGKALEGGVLRKEDEEKYKRILATLRDTPETAIYKVDQMLEDLKRDIEIYQHEQRLAGRRPQQSETPSDQARTPYKVGDLVTVKGQKVRVTKLLPDGKYEAVAVP